MDGLDHVGGEDALFAAHVQYLGVGAEHDTGQARATGQARQQRGGDGRAVFQGGWVDAGHGLVVDGGGDDVVLTRGPVLEPVAGLGREGEQVVLVGGGAAASTRGGQ